MSASTAITPAYLSTSEAAKYLGVTAEYLRALRCRGEGPAHARLSDAPRAAVRYGRDDLDNWVASRRVGGAA